MSEAPTDAGTPAAEVRHSSLRRPFASRGFRRLFAAQTISRWGDTFNGVALVILVYRLTGSGLKVALTVGVEVAPVLLFGFLAGALVDRYERRHVMIVADVGRALIAILLAVFDDDLTAVYLAAFGLSAFGVFSAPAAASVLPSIVDETELVAANSAVWSAAVISQIALAPVAGGLVALAGPSPAFVLNAATFIVSACLLRGLPNVSAVTHVPRSHVSDTREGLRHIRASRFLTVLTGVQALAALSAGATSALLVVLAEEHLGVGPSRFGVLIAAIGVGAGFGPLVVQKVVGDVRRRRFLFGPHLLRGAVDLVLAASSSFGVAVSALVVYGVGTSTGNVTYNSVLQSTIPDRLRGRVFAFYDVVWQSARLASIAVGGIAADVFGVTAIYWAGGVLLLGAGALGLLLAPSTLSSEPR